MIGRGPAVGMVAAALAVAACGGGESSGQPSDSDAVERGEATPVPGVSKLVTLLNGDTLTVPLDHEFRDLLGFESLGGRLVNEAGERVLTFEACGAAEAGMGPENGEPDQAVNVDFYYGRFEDRPLIVTFEARGPCNLIFSDFLDDVEALRLARTYTAVTSASGPGFCTFQDP